MTYMVCTVVCSQTVRKSYYKNNNVTNYLCENYVIACMLPMSLIKKKKVTAVRYEITSHFFLKYFYIVFKIFMFDETALYNLGPAQHTSFC